MPVEHLTGRTSRRHWLLVALSIGLALAVALSMALAGDAEAKKKKRGGTKKFDQTSTVSQAPVPPQPFTSITYTETPDLFSKTNKIRKLTNVTATLTAAVQFPNDEGLVLGLDGINTGISLTGRFGNVVAPNLPPVTVTGTPENSSAIVQALKADGQLTGNVIDETPATPNQIFVPGDPNTTLQLQGTQKKKKKKNKR
jgi:hypothetical protein